MAGIKFDVICWPYIISERNYFAINYDQTVTKNIFQPTWCEEAMILSQSAHGRNCTVDETSRQVTCYIQTGLNECFVFSNTQNYLMPFTWKTNCEIQWHRPLAVTSHFHSNKGTKDEQFKWNKYNDIKYSIAAEKILFVKWPMFLRWWPIVSGNDKLDSGSRFIIILRRLK